jgi:hypothetical protein
MEGSMRGEIIYEYRKLNPEDKKTFHRFLLVNAVVGAILLAGLIALTSKFSGDQSEATTQIATSPTQGKLQPERASVLPRR